MQEYKNLSWVWGADRKIRLRVTVWHHEALPSEAKQWSHGTEFLSAPNNHDRFFFFHTFWSPEFDFNIGVAINESRSNTLTSAILKVDIPHVVMMSTPNVLMAELHDFLYNLCIDNMCCYSFFICPTCQIRICKIRFASTGENCGQPYLVFKKALYYLQLAKWLLSEIFHFCSSYMTESWRAIKLS